MGDLRKSLARALRAFDRCLEHARALQQFKLRSQYAHGRFPAAHADSLVQPQRQCGEPRGEVVFCLYRGDDLQMPDQGLGMLPQLLVGNRRLLRQTFQRQVGDGRCWRSYLVSVIAGR